MADERKFDLYTFVAGDPLKGGSPVPVHCNCGGIITIFAPFEEEFVVCPKCESRIRIFVIDGDPGYVFGADQTGEPILIPVQGSSERALNMSPEAREQALRNVKERFGRKKK